MMTRTIQRSTNPAARAMRGALFICALSLSIAPAAAFLPASHSAAVSRVHTASLRCTRPRYDIIRHRVLRVVRALRAMVGVVSLP